MSPACFVKINGWGWDCARISLFLLVVGALAQLLGWRKCSSFLRSLCVWRPQWKAAIACLAAWFFVGTLCLPASPSKGSHHEGMGQKSNH